MLSLVTPAASAANHQLTPEQVPSIEERAEAVVACSGLPGGVAALVAKYAMEKERFDGEMFGFQQWIDCWGATPVTLPPIDKLREQVLRMITSTGRQLGNKEVEGMSAAECANLLELQGAEEHPEPADELYECLNRRVRPQDKLVAGFTCMVTYIPQFVRKDGKILSVTARTLALDLGPNPTGEGHAAKLLDNTEAFFTILTPGDANRTEPSCYFMMEQDVGPNTRRKKAPVLIEEISQFGDKRWQLPEPRNFFAAVFSRRAWKGILLYGQNPWTLTIGQGMSRMGYFLAFGGQGARGLDIRGYFDSGNSDTDGASASRKFPPKFTQ